MSTPTNPSVTAGIKRPRSQLSESSNSLDTMRPIIGYLRDDAVELVNDDDMNEAYYHGYYGKGTVSRRNPNKAMIIPQDLLHHWIQNITQIQAERQNIGSDTRHYDTRGGIGASSSNTSTAKDHVSSSSSTVIASSSSSSSVLPNSITDNTTTLISTDHSTISSTKPAAKYVDPLTLYANEFEHTIVNEPLPDAYYCASMISSHSHDVFHFHHARSIAHYVSCPPPRLRHVQPMQQPNSGNNNNSKNISSSLSTTSTNTNDTAMNPSPTTSSIPAASTTPTVVASVPASVSTKIRFEHMVFETSILEPEAVIYLLAKVPDRIIILPSALRGDDTFLSSDTIDKYEKAKLSLHYLWNYFCNRIRNFPARFSVYYYCRQLGYIVRDGHSFGTDFVLYTYGPGNGHAIAAVIVMPLLITTTTETGTDTTMDTNNDNHGISMDAVLPPPAVLAPLTEQDVLSNWEQLHAHARVVGTIRKSFILAYPSITLPIGGKHGESGALLPSFLNQDNSNYYSNTVARYLSNPRCVLGMMTDATANNDCTLPPVLASSVPEPSSLTSSSTVPTITMHLQTVSRWLTSKEHKFKSDILQSQVAAMEIFNENHKSDHAVNTVITRDNGNPMTNATENSTSNNTNNKPLTKQQRQQQLRQTLSEYNQYQKQQQKHQNTGGTSSASMNGGKKYDYNNTTITVLPTVTAMVLSLYDTDNDNECIRLAHDIIQRYRNSTTTGILSSSVAAEASSSSTSTLVSSSDPQPLENTVASTSEVCKYTKDGGPYHQSLIHLAYQQLYDGSPTDRSLETAPSEPVERVSKDNVPKTTNSWYLDRTVWGKVNTYGRR